ncbi:complement C1q-like protein 4 [Ylistrum balloti]|uniref:complement C1q-like protein 4 n=1 Tax=Ylistrum balloti TaxID=509963 RepID=UPI002905E0B9|nr:complement C1q-like protein 4 [Ylistrum balloti]
MNLYLVLCLGMMGLRLSSADLDLSDLKRELDEQKERLAVLEKELGPNTSPAKNPAVLPELLTKRAQYGYDTVVFSASLNVPFDSSRHNSPIPFDTVTINEGNGYSSATGVFTTPRDGVYMFYTSVAVNGDDAVHAQLQKNGVSQCACTSTHYGSGSCMVIIPLTVGDKVFVKEVFGTHLRAEHLTTFNGMFVI